MPTATFCGCSKAAGKGASRRGSRGSPRRRGPSGSSSLVPLRAPWTGPIMSLTASRGSVFEMPRVLLVEDDETIRRLVLFSLHQDGLEVETATDGASALLAFERRQPDLVVLDLLLPDIDGFEVCRRIRLLGPTPILMLTALVHEDNVVKGFELGADDYLTKPFSVRVFLARVEALLRRSGKPAAGVEQTIEIGDLVVDFHRVEVRLRGDVIDLTRTEFRILGCLARYTGQVVNGASLVRQIQDPTYDDRDALEIVRVHIRHLRNKIEIDPDRPRFIRTVRGFGYILDNPAKQELTM
ncbi:MAG: response regulator transcription factor [Chloroflexota bacterium]